MPAYSQKDIESIQNITVHFKSLLDREAFIKLVGQDQINPETNYIWYPKMERQVWTEKVKGEVKVKANRYPIYIVSKGRWELRHTARSLEALGIEYRIVIEPQEYDQYAKVIAPRRILTLPFKNLGQGSIPARNWIWDHSVQEGHERHWILDDNIAGFYCLNNNQKPKVTAFNPFTPIEQFTDFYENIGLSGMNYEFFIKRRTDTPAYYQNNRVYSCILIRNDMPLRWRGRYNEDADLSLRVLKSGLCTVLFNYIQAKKLPTMTVGGGNTDELYVEEGRLRMAESLKAQHPELVKISRKWGRWQHVVNYRPFRSLQLIPRR